MTYAHKTMQYIWFNRYKINSSNNPIKDPYCSAAWRINPLTISKINISDEEKLTLVNLLDSDDYIYPKKIIKFVRDLIYSAMGRLMDLNNASLTHGHTIGDREAVKFRSELLSSFRRLKSPTSFY